MSDDEIVAETARRLRAYRRRAKQPANGTQRKFPKSATGWQYLDDHVGSGFDEFGRWCELASRAIVRVHGNQPPRRPSNRPTMRLSTTKVRQIRRLQGKLSASKVAAKYGVTDSCVYRIWKRLDHRHV